MTQYSYSTFTGDGSTAAYTLSFDYMKRAHVSVHVDGTVKVDGTDYDWTADKQITFKGGKIPASGEKILISRDTPESDQIVLWQNGSYVVAEDLNESDLQWLYNIQELYDGIAKVDGGTTGPAVKKIIGTAPVEVDSTNAQEPDISVDETVSTDNPNALTSETRLMSEKAIDGAFSQAIGASSVYPPAGVTGKVGKLRIDDTGAEPKQFYWNGTAWVQIPTKGDKGDQGIQGPAGPPPGIQTPSATATNVPLQSGNVLGQAYASVSADSSGDLKFNFGIPVGQKGDKGDVGDGVNYLGEIDATTAPQPTDSKNGDFYVNTTAGTSSWTGLSTVGVNERLIYNGHTNKWDSYASTDLWQEAGDQLYPRNANADVLVGGTLPSAPNIRLLADGQGFFENTVSSPKFSARNTTTTNKLWSGGLSGVGTETSYIRADGNAEFAGNVKSESADGSFELNCLGYATSTRTDDNHSAFRALKDADLTFVTKTSGSTFIGNVQNEGTNNTSGNISLNADGSAVYLGALGVYRTAAAQATYAGYLNGANTSVIYADGKARFDDTVGIGNIAASPNISLNADGSGIFAKGISLNGSPKSLGTTSFGSRFGIGTSGQSVPGLLESSRDVDGSGYVTYIGGNVGQAKIRGDGGADFDGNLIIGSGEGVDGSEKIQLTLQNKNSSPGTETTLRFVNSSTNDPNNATVGAIAEITAVRKPGEFSDLVFKRNSGLETMRLDENGDVLIGGTLPSAPNISLNASGAMSGRSLSVNENSAISAISSTNRSDSNKETFKVTGSGGVYIGTNIVDSGANITLNANGSAEYKAQVTVSRTDNLGAYAVRKERDTYRSLVWRRQTKYWW